MTFTTLLIDADVLLHRAVAYATVRVAFDEVEHWEVDVKKAGGWIRREIQRYKDVLGAPRAILALGDRKANFRKALCPTYKAHRTSFPKPPGFLALEAKLIAHAKTVSASTLEGDDILGILATTEPTEGKCIVSIDKDLMQVPGHHYNPDKNVVLEVSEDEGDIFHLVQTLTGDRVDGYPGCPGVGKVKAGKILAGDTETAWERVVAAFEKTIPQLDDDAGTPALWRRAEQAALLQARLARVLRNDDYNKKTKEIRLWLPAT